MGSRRDLCEGEKDRDVCGEEESRADDVGRDENSGEEGELNEGMRRKT
jgi:hypothetical protein